MGPHRGHGPSGPRGPWALIGPWAHKSHRARAGGWPAGGGGRPDGGGREIAESAFKLQKILNYERWSNPVSFHSQLYHLKVQNLAKINFTFRVHVFRRNGRP